MKANTEKENGTIPGKYEYQLQAAKKICGDVENTVYMGALLNGAVGSGKTIVLIHCLNIITSKNPDARILFLTHAQNSLKQQTRDTFINGPIKPCFTYGTLGEVDKQVTVAIPQEFYGIRSSLHFEYAVVDECHQWLNSNSVARNIIQRFQIKKLILASGTISNFVKSNQETSGKKFAITTIAGEDVQQLGLYSALDLDLVRVTNLNDIFSNLRAAFNKAKANSDSMDRPVVVCTNCNQAVQAKQYLESCGYRVALATSKHDPQNQEIENFKAGNKTALILVGRGLVGLNIPQADLMIDLKRSTNIEVVLQYVARMYRQHPDGRKKCFLRITTPQDWNRDVILLYKILSLNKADVMKNFNGKNLNMEVGKSY
ncbi:MAG: DEAD/DEAH box helicase family protein [Bdellovibrionales bacterium]|nr:DEAD/DEAH box helicase family protein [Bdellovibrionales bacterium]